MRRRLQFVTTLVLVTHAAAQTPPSPPSRAAVSTVGAVSLNERLQAQQQQALLLAAQQGRVEAVTSLLEQGITADVPGADGSYPLQWAAATAVADATLSVRLMQVLLDAAEGQDREHSAQRRMHRAAIVTLAELRSSIGELDKFEVGQSTSEGMVDVVKLLGPSSPAATVNNLLASVVCAVGVKTVTLLINRCRMDDADSLLTLLPCIADSAKDPTPLPTRLAALMERVATRRFHGHEAEAQAVASSVLGLSEAAAVELYAGEINATDRKAAGTLTMRARALLAMHQYEEAFSVYRRLSHAVPRRLSSGRVMLPTEVTAPVVMSIFQLEHDLTQLKHLQEHAKLTGGSARLEEAQAAYEAGLEAVRPLAGATGVASLPYGRIPDAVRGLLSSPLHLPTEMGESYASRSVLNQGQDWAAKQASYMRGEVVVLDDFLAADAFAELQTLALEATVWHESKQHGYLGAFDALGFAPNAIARLASELEAAMPAAFGNNTLQQFWGYKYDNTRKYSFGSAAINVHADEASVNVNFWITPDDANLDPASGGMVVWSKLGNELDDASTRRAYANVGGDVSPEEKARILGLTDSDAATVPYRANRAVLFRSSLYHKTDKHSFRPGFKNCRINFTLLFGRQEDVRCRSSNA